MDDRNIIEFAKAFDDGASASELERRASGLKEIQQQFIKIGDTYRYKDVPDVVAFTETEQRISTSLDNDDVAIAMTSLAQSKGWQFYMTYGSSTFYESVATKSEKLSIEREQLEQSENTDRTADTTENIRQSAQAIEKPDIVNVISADSTDDNSEEIENQRRISIVTSVSEKYRVAGNKYYFKDQAGSVNKLAFKDSGTKLSTSLNSERVTQSLIELADSKGWRSIKVSGHIEFKRQAWRAATERGIELKGYTPDASDLALNVSKTEQNTIMPDITKNPAPNKSTIGQLIAYGHAPYRNDPSNNASYYVTINTGDKEKTVWGVGLSDAIKISGVQLGDDINLQMINKSTQTKGSRNNWSIERAGTPEVITAVASAVAANKVNNENDRKRFVESVNSRVGSSKGNIPVVSIYDNKTTQTQTIETSNSRQKTPELVR